MTDIMTTIATPTVTTTESSTPQRLDTLRNEFVTLQPSARQKDEGALARLQTLYEEVSEMFDSPMLPVELEVDCGELQKQLRFYLSAMKFLQPITEEQPQKAEKREVLNKRRGGGKRGGKNHRYSKVTPRKVGQKEKRTPAKQSKGLAAPSKKRYNRSVEEVTPPPSMKRKARFMPSQKSDSRLSFPARRLRKLAPVEAEVVEQSLALETELDPYDF